MKPVEDPPVKDQAAEISRLKGVIAKCQSALAQCKQWKEGVNTLTTHNHEAVQEALAVIQGIDQLRAENERLKAELAEAKKDAELWREREAKIKSLRERGFLGSPLRGEPYKIDMKGK